MYWLRPAFRPRSRGRDSRADISKRAIVRLAAEPVAKVIGALTGDLMNLEPGWVAVNGVKFSNSQTAARDSASRSLAHARWACAESAPARPDCGFNDAQFGGRATSGPVPAGGVRGVLRLW